MRDARLRRVIGWAHLYAGLLVGLEHPGSGALFVAVGVCWFALRHGD